METLAGFLLGPNRFFQVSPVWLSPSFLPQWCKWLVFLVGRSNNAFLVNLERVCFTNICMAVRAKLAHVINKNVYTHILVNEGHCAHTQSYEYSLHVLQTTSLETNYIMDVIFSFIKKNVNLGAWTPNFCRKKFKMVWWWAQVSEKDYFFQVWSPAVWFLYLVLWNIF